MVYSTNNPSAIRSQQWLVDALLALMEEKPYDKITIKELTEKATLDRSTFYRNFNSKEAVLDLHLNHLAQEYLRRLNAEEEMDMRKVSKIFMAFWFENLDFICLLRKNDLDGCLLKAFNQYLPSIHRVTQGKFAYTLSEANMEFALAFNAGGMWNILMKWIDTDFERSYDDLVKAFEEISQFNFLK